MYSCRIHTHTFRRHSFLGSTLTHSHCAKKLNTRLEKIEEITFLALSLSLCIGSPMWKTFIYLLYIVLHNWSKNEMSAVHGTRESKWRKKIAKANRARAFNQSERVDALNVQFLVSKELHYYWMTRWEREKDADKEKFGHISLHWFQENSKSSNYSCSNGCVESGRWMKNAFEMQNALVTLLLIHIKWPILPLAQKEKHQPFDTMRDRERKA